MGDCDLSIHSSSYKVTKCSKCNVQRSDDRLLYCIIYLKIPKRS